jgi:O-antigen ligase
MMRLSQRLLVPVAVTAAVLLLASMYFVQSRVLADVAISMTGCAALLALFTGAEGRGFLRGLLLWSVLAIGLLAAAVAISPEVELAAGLSAVHSLSMICGFVVCARVLLRRFGAERVLLVLFAAAAVSALASVALHLLTAEALTQRIAMLGRARNPIPAAAGVAAAGLAGLALLRAGRIAGPWRLAAWAGLGVILLAMLLTQSRGPLIGVVLGAALLVLPPRAPRLTVILPPLVLLACSSLILLEAPLRALFCTDAELLCRPSERLPLWQHSLALIAEAPLFGHGMGHQLGTGWLNNPQNGLLGTAVYFGLPFLLAALVGVRAAAAPPGDTRVRPGDALGGGDGRLLRRLFRLRAEPLRLLQRPLPLPLAADRGDPLRAAGRGGPQGWSRRRMIIRSRPRPARCWTSSPSSTSSSTASPMPRSARMWRGSTRR